MSTDEFRNLPLSNEAGETPDASPSSLFRSHQSLSELWSPELEADKPVVVDDLGQVLLNAGVIQAEQLTNAHEVLAKSPGLTLGDVLYDMGVDEAVIQKTLARTAGLTFERIDESKVEVEYLDRLGHDFCKTHGVMPLRVSGTRLFLGVTHPDNLVVIDEVRHKLGMPVKTVVVCRDNIAAVIDAFRDEDETTIDVNEIIGGIEEDDVEVVQTHEEEVDLEKMAGESPVIRFVNYLIFNAVKDGASDIHIEPQEKKLQVRYRIDGVLFATMSP
ncbi:MAG: hypothetical protein V3U29_09305, partial [Phycisphaeraceae bacterium]